MESLFKKHCILISQTSTEIVREMMRSVNWKKQLVSIRGSHGVGKTTLMRQYIRQNYGVNPVRHFTVWWIACISPITLFLRQLIDSISWVESTCSLTRYTNTPPGAKKWKKSLICGQIWRLPSRGHRLFRFWMLMQTCRAGCSVTTWLVCRSSNPCVSTSILNCPYILWNKYWYDALCNWIY